MNRVLRYGACVVLALCGLALVAGFVAIAAGWVSTRESVREAGMLLGLGFAALVAAAFLVLSERAASPRTKLTDRKVPPFKLLVPVFVAILVVGVLMARSDVAVWGEPVVALLAVTVTVLLFLRLASRWRWGKDLPMRAVLAPIAWGMVAATSLAVVFELAFAGASLGGLWVGLRSADVPATRDLLDLLQSDRFLTEQGSDLARTNSVVLFAVLGYAIAAPIIEEFTKFLGVFLVMRRRVLDQYAVFIAAVSVGLGFAAVETLMYSLASGTSWPYILALRTPVALIHLTGTVLVALGWYHHTKRGGVSWAGGYAFAVLVHAGWNGLLIALMLGSAGAFVNDEPSTSFVLAAMAAFALMAALLICCFVWFNAVARKLGRTNAPPTQITDRAPLVPGFHPVSSPSTLR